MDSDNIVILFYAFTPIADSAAFRDAQKELCIRLGLRGRLLIAPEGINGTLEGTARAIRAYEQELRIDARFRSISFKESAGTGHAFTKLEIKARDEIVTLGMGAFDVQEETAPAITAEELDALYDSGEEFVVLDLRNEYEIQAGKFEKTVHPGLSNFRDLPEKIPEIAHLKGKKVIAVCTGGIRCEKATCLLRREGFADLYQLEDGIHSYMRSYPGKRFKGTLFVFDNRMVTPVADASGREVIGHCFSCYAACESFYSDDSVRPSKKVLCCDACSRAHPELRECAALAAS